MNSHDVINIHEHFTIISGINKYKHIIKFFGNTNLIILPEGHTLGFKSPAGTKKNLKNGTSTKHQSIFHLRVCIASHGRSR